jgi:IS30 family transposase
MGYQRITMEEREEIFRPRYEEHLFLWEIGQKLHKDKSAISRELKRGTKNKLYNPITAEANHRSKENSEHKLFTERTGIKVYFCHPHSPWEKGTCENTNFLIRDMLGDVTDFRELNQRDISQITKRLNDRPRKTLDFQTPNEVLFELR